jgi:hypothetical protein
VVEERLGRRAAAALAAVDDDEVRGVFEPAPQDVFREVVQRRRDGGSG